MQVASSNQLGGSKWKSLTIKGILVFFIIVGTVDFILISVTGGRINPIASIKTVINSLFGWKTIYNDETHFDAGTLILILSSICSILYDIIALFWILKPFEFNF
jgi:hypothetical protein